MTLSDIADKLEFGESIEISRDPWSFDQLRITIRHRNHEFKTTTHIDELLLHNPQQPPGTYQHPDDPILEQFVDVLLRRLRDAVHGPLPTPTPHPGDPHARCFERTTEG